MSDKEKNKFFTIELPNLNEEIEKSLGWALSDEEYSIAIDIAHRSRELSKLYMDAKDAPRAIQILEILLDFCYHYEPLNNPEFFLKDIERLIELYKFRHDKKSIIALLTSLTERYPDHTRVSEFKYQLAEWSKKKKS